LIKGSKLVDFKPEGIKGVISDLMCTLFNPGVPEVAVKVWAEHVNLPVDKLLTALDEHDIAAGVGEVRGLGRVEDRVELIKAWMRSVLTQAGGSQVSDGEAVDYAHRLAAISARCGKAYPQARLLLQSLRQSGRKVGILSTVSPRGRLAAKNLGFDEPWVDVALFSSEVGKAKETHFDVYAEAAARLGLSPRQCLFVDDHIDYLRAAKSDGITSVVVLHKEGYTAQMIKHGQLNRKQIEDEGIITIDQIAELGELLQLPQWKAQKPSTVMA
jgi:HAD superfamily hydrolase (TIGR01509 family)